MNNHKVYLKLKINFLQMLMHVTSQGPQFESQSGLQEDEMINWLFSY